MTRPTEASTDKPPFCGAERGARETPRCRSLLSHQGSEWKPCSGGGERIQHDVVGQGGHQIVDLPESDPHWSRWMREQVVAWAERLEVTTLSRILESVRRRTMTLKEEGQ